MAKNAGHDISHCLLLEILELKLKFFPAIKYTDLKKTAKGPHGRPINTLSCTQPINHLLRWPTPPHSQVTYASKSRGVACTMERYKNFGMPWVEMALLRLPSSLLRTEQLTVLTFVSCVGMLMNHDCISYEELKVLV